MTAISQIDDDVFADVLAGVRAFVRERVVPREIEIHDTDAIPANLRRDAAEMGRLVKIAADRGFRPQWFGTSAIATPDFAKIAGSASNGVLMTFYLDPSRQPAAAAVVTAAGRVDWVAAAPLAAGLLSGSVLGPVLARRLPARIVRAVAALSGAALAAVLLLVLDIRPLTAVGLVGSVGASTAVGRWAVVPLTRVARERRTPGEAWWARWSLR